MCAPVLPRSLLNTRYTEGKFLQFFAPLSHFLYFSEKLGGFFTLYTTMRQEKDPDRMQGRTGQRFNFATKLKKFSMMDLKNWGVLDEPAKASADCLNRLLLQSFFTSSTAAPTNGGGASYDVKRIRLSETRPRLIDSCHI